MQGSLRQAYRQELESCKTHFRQVNLQKERGYLMKFTTFSATVENLLPSIPSTSHEALFQELLLQQVFSSFDQECLLAGDVVKLRGWANTAATKSEPKIYCTYHLGSYRLLTSVLFRKGLDCVLLVGKNMNRVQGEGITKHIEQLRAKHGYTNYFRILEIGTPSVGLTVLRELKAGRSIIVYVDGSPETAPQPGEDEQFLSVKFGDRKILARKGVGYFSHMANVPIVPVVSYREANLTNVLQFLTPIKPVAHRNRDTYCQEAIQQLYDVFWPYVKKFPAQWEGWNYIHSFLELQSPKKKPQRTLVNRPVFNDGRYTVCDLEQTPILFDRRLYQTYEITEDLRDLLLNMNAEDSIEGVVGKALFRELVEMEILC